MSAKKYKQLDHKESSKRILICSSNEMLTSATKQTQLHRAGSVWVVELENILNIGNIGKNEACYQFQFKILIN